MEISLLSPALEHDYEVFLQSHDTALLYHSLRYRNFLIDLLGCKPIYFVAIAHNRVIGCFPLMAATGRFGSVLNSLPYFGSNGGAIAESEPVASALWDQYLWQAASPAIASATAILNPLLPEPTDIKCDYTDERVGFITRLDDLSNPETDLMMRVDSSTRRNIRKALSLDIEVTIDNGCMDFLQTIHCENMAAMNAQAKSPDFFFAVSRNFRFGVDYNIYVARLGGEPIAALLVFYYSRTVEYFMPAVRHENRSDQPMAAILFRAMCDSARAGFTRWNWGGSWPSHVSLQRFKKKWGGEERRYRYLVKVNNREILASSPAVLGAAYPNFYLIPYSTLSGGDVLRTATAGN